MNDRFPTHCNVYEWIDNELSSRVQGKKQNREKIIWKKTFCYLNDLKKKLLNFIFKSNKN